MVEVNIHEAKTHLSPLIARVEAGEQVVISRPAPRSPSWFRPRGHRPSAGTGASRGQIRIADDFDELPDDLAEAFGLTGP